MYGSKCVVIISEVLCKIRFYIFIFVVAEMFFESRMEGSAGLSSVFLITVFTNQLVYTALLELFMVLVTVTILFLGQ